MVSYLLFFLAGALAMKLGSIFIKTSSMSVAMYRITIFGLVLMRSLDKSLDEAAEITCEALEKANAQKEEIEEAKLLWVRISKTWRTATISQLTKALSAKGIAWAGWNDWDSAMKYLDKHNALGEKKEGGV